MFRRLPLPFSLLLAGVVVIPAARAADERCPPERAVKSYSLREVLERSTGGQAAVDARPLVEAIRTCIEPETWSGASGGEAQGTLRLATAAGSEATLVVDNTAAVHRQIEAFLAELARLRTVAARQQAIVPVPPARSAEEEAIQQVLDQPGTLEFVETPLQDIAAYVEETHKLKVRIDRDALRAAGIRDDPSITKCLARIPLRSLLRLMLRDVGLTWIHRDGGLLITTPQKARTALSVRLYDIRDLTESAAKAVPAQPGKRGAGNAAAREISPDPLVAAVQRCLLETGDDERTDAGKVLLYDAAPLRVLIALETDEGHEQIESLLGELRRMRLAALGQLTFAPLTIRPAWQEALRKKLIEPTKIEYIEAPLQDVVDYLKDYHEMEIQIDRPALKKADIGGAVPVTKNLKAVTLRSALRLMLGEQGLTYMLRDHVLLLTTPAENETCLQTRVYDVRDLVQPEPGESSAAGSAGDAAAGRASANLDALAELIITCVTDTTWDGAADLGCIVPFDSGPLKVLIVKLNQETHDKIDDVLERLRAVQRHERAGHPEAIAEIPPDEAALRRILAQPTECEFIETPLQDVIDYLKDRHHVEIQIDRKALDDVGVGSDKPVTLNISGVSLETALDLMLKPLGLTWTLTCGVIFITRPEEEESDLIVRAYGVRDLARRTDSAGHMTYDFDSLLDVITRGIQRRAWDETGGPGAAVPIEADHLHALVVAQSWPMHRKVEDLLTDLRAVRRQVVPGSPPAPPRLSPGEAAARKALTRRISVDFRQRPLDKIVAALRKQCGIEIQLDHRALEDAGIDEKTPVTLERTNTPLAAILMDLVKPRQLAWTVDRGVLLITTPEEEDLLLVPRVYDVADLVEGRGPEAWKRPIETVRSLAPKGWDDSGGLGVLAPYASGDLAALVVLQTWKVHWQTEERLAELRKAAAAEPPPADAPRLPSGWLAIPQPPKR